MWEDADVVESSDSTSPNKPLRSPRQRLQSEPKHICLRLCAVTRFQSWEPHNVNLVGIRSAHVQTLLHGKKKTKTCCFSGAEGEKKSFICAHGGARSAVGMKKETKCCEEATSHDIIVFVE